MELAQAQRMEAIGQLAAGIAHEINTPTQYIGDNTRFLQDAFGEINPLLDAFDRLLQAAQTDSVTDDLIEEAEAKLRGADLGYLTREIPQAIQQSLEGVEHVANIVGAMKEFSHPNNGQKQAVDLNHVIEGAITLCCSEWKYVAELVTDFDPELPRGLLSADRRQPRGDEPRGQRRPGHRRGHAATAPTARESSRSARATTSPTRKSAWKTRAWAFPRKSAPASSTCSSPPRRSAKGPARAWPWSTRSWSRNTAERSALKPRSAGEPPSSSGCRSTDNPNSAPPRPNSRRASSPCDERPLLFTDCQRTNVAMKMGGMGKRSLPVQRLMRFPAHG